jgi:hypothetical protein
VVKATSTADGIHPSPTLSMAMRDVIIAVKPSIASLAAGYRP